MTIQAEDDFRIESLKKSLKVRSKIDVLRLALSSLEQQLHARNKRERLRRAARIVAGESARVNREFQKYSLLRHFDD